MWVSEVMLQQTRVDTVLRYYGPWLERFPDVEALAAADLDDVLLAWEGLGYYRRARFLHRAAAIVREEHGGRVPSTYDGLRTLPGLGEYAAGAVASIAFGRPVPAVDGNVRRVFARLFDVAEPKAGWLRDMGTMLVDPDRPGDWNQALMDLGATICTPKSPRCEACPLAAWCAARAAGTQEKRPAPTKKKEVPSAVFAVVVAARDDGRVLVERRPEGGLLGGMWSFPEARLDGDGVSEAEMTLVEAAAAASRGWPTGTDGVEARPLPSVRHRFSHLDATYRPVVLVAGDSAASSPTIDPAGAGGDDAHRWIDPSAPDVALPVAQQKIAAAAAAELEEMHARS